MTCAGCTAELPPNKGRGRARKWCSEECRKQTLYAPPPCENCGATRRYNGHPPTSGRCATCEAAWARENTRRWILDSFTEWFAIFGAPPVATDWNHALARHIGHRASIKRYESTGRPWPCVSTVQNVFGSWNAAVAEAGFTPLAPSQRVGEVPWPRERIIAALQAWHAEHGRTPTCKEWERATPDTPCKNTVEYHFRTWNAAIRAAGFEAREHASKLTLEQARQIRESDATGTVLAARFGVCPTTISLIRNGRTWREAKVAA